MDVTIVIPVFNRAHCLLRTLQSIPATYPIIVVDNGSSDASAALAEDYCRQRSGAVFAVEHTEGAAAARNRGLALCTTEWVYFFDSDDEFTALPQLPDSALVEALDVVCFPVNMVVDGRARVRDYRPTADAAYHVLSSMLGTQSMIFRTTWLQGIGGWDAHCRIWDDWELGLRVLLSSPRLQWVSREPQHRIYVHDDSLTGPSYAARWERIRNALVRAYDDVGRKGDKRTLSALDLRVSIVCGQLRREGAPAAAEAIRPLQQQSSWQTRLVERYVLHGGRGAWRLALLLL